MKKSFFTLVIILLLATSTNLFAQSTVTLDKKNGFQNFKFNTKLNNYTKYKPKEIQKGHYSLQDISSVVIGDYPIEGIDLYFKDDLLVRISVRMDDIDRTRNEVIYRGLMKNYAKQTVKNTSSVIGTYSQNMIWKGEYVSLTYKLTSYRDNDVFQTKIYLIYQLDLAKRDVSDYL